MLSWAWILWLLTLWTVNTCSLRIRCSVLDGNLQKHRAVWGSLRPNEKQVFVEFDCTVRKCKPLHPLLVLIHFQNKLWSYVDDQDSRMVWASCLVSEGDDRFSLKSTQKLEESWFMGCTVTLPAADWSRLLPQTPQTDTRQQWRRVRGQWEYKPVLVGSAGQ